MSIKRVITKLKSRGNLTYLVALATMFVFLFGSSVITSAPVGADAPVNNEVQTYCLTLLPSNFCQKTEDFTFARNIGSYHCTDKPTNGGVKEACITKNAKSYVKKAAGQHPSSPADFSKKLNKVFASAGGNPYYPSPDATKGESPSVTCPENGCGDPAIYESNCSGQRCDLIGKYVTPTVKLLSGLVGLIVVVSLIFGAIQYAASEGDPQKASRAKHRIANTIVALIAYIFLFVFLQFLVPGGVFNR